MRPTTLGLVVLVVAAATIKCAQGFNTAASSLAGRSRFVCWAGDGGSLGGDGGGGGGQLADQSATPWASALVDEGAKVRAPFFFPGHAMGGGLVEGGVGDHDMHRLDLPEIPGLDALDAPEGPLLEAQMLAADLFRSKRTW